MVVEEGVAAIGGWIGALWLTGPEGTLELLHWTGVEPGRRFRRVPLAGDSPLALAVRTATPVWIASRAEYVAAFPQSEQGVTDPDSGSSGEIASACLPLVAGDGAIGGLMFAYRVEHDFTAEERAFLISIASQCAHALERLRLIESVSRLYTAEAEARRLAEAASRAKDEFLALLGHELRNPLAPIVTALSLMKLRRGADHERERQIIERQVHHLVRLVDDLLDISRITKGAVELVRAPVSLARAVSHSAEAAQPLLEERGHRLSLDLAEELVVDADIHRLVQVIANLLTNAAKYTPDGGHIALAVHGDGSHARITVHDNGVGIPPELLPHVFDMFVQGQRSADRSQGGLGIGLSVVRRLVELHAGSVSVASDGPGRGTTVQIRLPLSSVPASRAEPPPTPRRSANGRRMLVVDDNVDAADSLAQLLRLNGHEAETAYDGRQALERMRARHVDVVLLDIGLPGMDGYEVARRMRAEHGSIGLVAVTGYGQASDVENAKSAGFDAHITKPAEIEELERVLTRI